MKLDDETISGAEAFDLLVFHFGVDAAKVFNLLQEGELVSVQTDIGRMTLD